MCVVSDDEAENEFRHFQCQRGEAGVEERFAAVYRKIQYHGHHCSDEEQCVEYVSYLVY